MLVTLVRNMGGGGFGGGRGCIAILVLTELYGFFEIFCIYSANAYNYYPKNILSMLRLLDRASL